MKNLEKLLRRIDEFMFWILLVSVFLIPLFINPNNYNYFVLPKTLLVTVAAILSAGLLLASFYFRKQIIIIRSSVDWLILSLLGISLISSIFSISRTESLIGRTDYFVNSFYLIAIFALYFWQIIQVAENERRLRFFQNSLLLAGVVTASLFILKSLVNTKIISSILPGVWNTVDVTNTGFAVWLVIVVILGVGRLVEKTEKLISKAVPLFAVLVGLVGLYLLQIRSAWALLAFGLFLISIYFFSNSDKADKKISGVALLLGIISIVFAIIGGPKLSSVKFPLEVSLGSSPSREIVMRELFSGSKDFLLGGGPGTFSYTFSKFRSAAFNLDQVASSLRFNYPNNTIEALLSEQGFIFAVLLLVTLVFVLVKAFKIYKVKEVNSEDKNEEVQSAALFAVDPYLNLIILLVLTLGMITTFYSITLWWLWWFMLGMVVAGFALLDRNGVRALSIHFENEGERSTAISFGIIVAGAVILIPLISAARWCYADRAFAKVFSQNDLQLSETLLKKSMKIRNTDIAHAALAQVYLDKAVAASREANPDVGKISDLLGKALTEGKSATELSPNSVGQWENLARMYESTAQLVPEARAFAIDALSHAKALEPSSYSLTYRLAVNFEQNKNYNEAIQFYREAMNLKTDSSEARIALANVYELNGEADKAIALLEPYIKEATQDVNNSFNYGRLLYNRNQKGDRDLAERIWLEVLKKEPNHSNTLYSLGALYEQKKNYRKALEYFYKVRDLNPLKADNSNKDAVQALVQKINKLEQM